MKNLKMINKLKVTKVKMTKKENKFIEILINI